MSTVFARAPLRVSFAGGGTDLPSHYRQHGGFVVSAAIDRCVYLLASDGFQPRFRLKHLHWEEADDPRAVEHPILREALARHWSGGPLEVASVADAPPGTGLGSSGAYTVCAVRALLRLGARDGRPDPAPAELAELASDIELGALGRTVGKQDQYVSAHGGVCAMSFGPGDEVEVRPLELPPATRDALADRFLLFFTGGERSAADMFSDQVRRSLAGDAEMTANLDRTREVAHAMCAALEDGRLDDCAELLNAGWELKRGRASAAATERVEELRAVALRSGATGATLMGAGGSGFLLVLAPEPDAARRALTAAGAAELSFSVAEGGCSAERF